MDVGEIGAVGHLEVVDAVDNHDEASVFALFFLERGEQFLVVERGLVFPDFQAVVAHVTHEGARRLEDSRVDFFVRVLLAHVEHRKPGEHRDHAVEYLAARRLERDVDELDFLVGRARNSRAGKSSG